MRKAIAVILTLGLFFSVFSPLRTVELSTGGALLNAVAASSTVLSCFSVTAVPFAFLSGFIGKEFSLADAFYPVPQNDPEKKDKPRPVSSDMAFTGFSIDLKAPARGAPGMLSGIFPGMLHPEPRVDPGRHDPGGGGGVTVFLLLAYLVLLSRSNLPPAACRAIALFRRETRPAMNGRVSSFPVKVLC